MARCRTCPAYSATAPALLSAAVPDAALPRQLLLRCSTSCIHAVVLHPWSRTSCMTHMDVGNADFAWSKISAHAVVRHPCSRHALQSSFAVSSHCTLAITVAHRVGSYRGTHRFFVGAHPVSDRVPSPESVGWVERSETHHCQVLSMGFGRFAIAFAARTTPSLRSVAALYPSYVAAFAFFADGASRYSRGHRAGRHRNPEMSGQHACATCPHNATRTQNNSTVPCCGVASTSPDAVSCSKKCRQLRPLRLA